MRKNDFTIEELINKYAKKIYTLAYHILSHHQDAEDVVQDTFITLINKLPGFQGRSHIYTWIYRIALNKALEHKRRMNKIINKSFDENIERKNQPLKLEWEKEFQTIEGQVLLKEVLADIREKCHHFMSFSLSDEQRMVFILRDVMDLKYKDLSRILEVSENVIKARLKRARNNLKKRLTTTCSYHNPENPCQCQANLGYLLNRYPQILTEAKKRINHPDYLNLMEKKNWGPKTLLKKIYQEFSMKDYDPNKISKLIEKKAI